MKKFTKVLAAFCAMAMIFGTFSATVLADEVENPADQPAAEEVAEEEKKDEEPAAEEPAAEEPAAEEPEAEESAAEEPAAAPAEADAPAEEPEEPTVIEQQAEVADVPGIEAVNEGETATPFANGEITQAAIDANGGELPETTGTYTLVENVSVPGHSHIDDAGTNITIDLNGHTITYTGTENLYTIGFVEDITVEGSTRVVVHGNSVLTIKDTGSNGKIVASGTTKGSEDHWISINTSNGYPSHGTESYKRGGCILVQNSCTFILEGGTISGFHSESDGGAIHISNGGHVIMSGGRITDCHSDSVRPNDDGAGAISCHCTSKGTSVGHIWYMSSEDEEAVETTLSLKGSLKITGGKIDNCSGKQGGAVRILRGDFEMTGGTIENNTGLNGGGILYMNNSKGSFKISGNVVIAGNHTTGNDAAKANVWLLDGVAITLSGNLDSAAKIEFGTSKVTNNVFNTNGKTYSIDSFVSNHAGYYAYASGNNIKLKQGTLPSFDKARITVSEGIYFEVLVNPGTFADSVTVSYSYPYNKNGTDKSSSGEIALADAEAYGDEYLFKIPVISAAMTAPITVEINYDSDRKVTHDPFTIENYANTIIDGDIGGKGEVARALLIYGAYSQVKFGINTTDPYHLPEGTGISDYTAAVDFGLTGAEYTDISAAGKTVFYGGTVSFESNTVVNLYFRKAELDAALGGATPTLNVKYNESTTVGISAEESGDYYIFRVKGTSGKGFYPGQYTDSFEFSFAGTEISGNYSVEAYLKNIVYKTSSLQNMKNLAQAYYNLAEKA